VYRLTIGDGVVLIELINYLETQDPEIKVPLGLCNPHSYRGYYDQLAFEPTKGTTVAKMLACAKGALGETFEGYKGGDFKMKGYTEVNLADYGNCGEEISLILLKYMCGDITK